MGRGRGKGGNGGRQENAGGLTSGVWGNNRWRETSGVDHKSHGVDHESHGVGEGEWGREASGVAENPGGGRHRVGRGVGPSKRWPND